MSILNDLSIGDKGEQLVKQTLENLGFECEFNKDKKIRQDYDLLIKPDITVEIKNDIYSKRSGNVAIEYFNSKSKKPSGIAATKAQFWCHIISEIPYICTVDSLKNFIATEKPKRTLTNVGDGNADILLFSIEHIVTILTPLENFKSIWKQKKTQKKIQKTS